MVLVPVVVAVVLVLVGVVVEAAAAAAVVEAVVIVVVVVVVVAVVVAALALLLSDACRSHDSLHECYGVNIPLVLGPALFAFFPPHPLPFIWFVGRSSQAVGYGVLVGGRVRSAGGAESKATS